MNDRGPITNDQGIPNGPNEGRRGLLSRYVTRIGLSWGRNELISPARPGLGRESARGLAQNKTLRNEVSDRRFAAVPLLTPGATNGGW
jgi:hypothetical protein